MTGATGTDPRPGWVLVFAGTGTEVGKTWVACATAQALRSQGLRVAARKPVQSYSSADDAAPLEPTDADLLAAATGVDPSDVCPPHRWYAVAMAPPMAADAIGRGRIELDELVAEMRWSPGTDIGIVETAGGVRSPIAHDGDSAALAARLTPDQVVLVAHAGLGTINDVRLSAGALHPLPIVVFLNRYDDSVDLHRRNRSWLEDVDGMRVVTEPRQIPVRGEASPGQI